MTEDKQKILSRKQLKRSRTDKGKQLQQMNRTLNYGIAIVSVLIVLVTVIILNGREDYQSVEPTEQQDKAPVVNETETEEKAVVEEEDVVYPETSSTGEHTISQSADANVIEVWTNETWMPYKTAQTGTHTSVFEDGHIDYEEKLAATFSVLPIEQQISYVLSARNNGDAKSARIVVSNKDKSENYRVIIEWIEGEGWLPTSVDVLHSVDGVR